MHSFGKAASWVGSKLWSWTAHSLNLDTIEHRGLRSMLALWHQTRDADGVPWLERFDPRTLGPEVRQLALVDISAGVKEARYRLVGSGLIKLYGGDLTGRLIRECYTGTVLSEVQEAYTKVQAERWPLYSTREFHIFGRSFGYRRLLLPLSRDGAEVSHVVLGLYPSSSDLTDASQWRPYEEDLAAESFRDAFGSVPLPGAARPVKPLVRPVAN